MQRVLQTLDKGGARARARAEALPFAQLRAELDASSLSPTRAARSGGDGGDLGAPVRGGPCQCRIYQPRLQAEPAPALAFFDGGNWALSSADARDPLARGIAAGWAVVLVNAAREADRACGHQRSNEAERKSARHPRLEGHNPLDDNILVRLSQGFDAYRKPRVDETSCPRRVSANRGVLQGS